ncbi:hypothetical protein [Spirosoma validum]|uniref:Uncharacterized protein n=1 Tax=Spirosoma validum TaxID=2771355 RepID=A0A927GE38_9BACT|nr:hypothetical protein [Spirosoma validum]MBD2754210.1 hypothetical protein [Spirosoma validum]
MKVSLLLITGIGLLAVAGLVYGQDDGTRKPLNNPMYSTHNYKHPNLAAAARRWENKKGVAVKKPAPNDAQLANYKTQMPIAQPVGGITIEHTQSVSLPDRNYKIQRLREPQPLGPPSEYYVKKQQRRTGVISVGE